jgi:hypothetical protein
MKEISIESRHWIGNLYEGKPTSVETLFKENRGVGVGGGGRWVASCV